LCGKEGGVKNMGAGGEIFVEMGLIVDVKIWFQQFLCGL
jgi:hypothetical protein